MEESHEVHRHTDGSIDFDFYRAQSTALRSQAMRDAFKLKATTKFMLIMLALVVSVAVIQSLPTQWTSSFLQALKLGQSEKDGSTSRI